MMTLWIDSDACPRPIKEVIYKVSQRRGIPVILVANSYMQIPLSPLISFVQVEKGDDMADKYIAENCALTDLVITQDIPLAALIVEKGAHAINPRGELYDEDNISERLSMRNFMKELRDSGEITGGPAPFGPKDVEKFTNSIDKLLTKLIK